MDERALARKVLDYLPKERPFRGRLLIEEVSWDDPGAPTPLAAHLTPEEAIHQHRPKPSECDIVVVRRSYETYDSPSTFVDRLERELRELIASRLEAESSWKPGTTPFNESSVPQAGHIAQRAGT